MGTFIARIRLTRNNKSKQHERITLLRTEIIVFIELARDAFFTVFF